MAIEYNSNDTGLSSQEFLKLFSTFWPHRLETQRIEKALNKTINITARENGLLVGCTRVLTDGYLFAIMTEVLVRRGYGGLGIGKRLFELAEAASPTHICFGAQTVNAAMMEQLGWRSGPVTYFKRKK